MSVPFSGPANWDGSCTNEGGLSAGTMCGNEPCAQSVWAAPLDPPANDACSAKTKNPSFTKEHTWKTRAITCALFTKTRYENALLDDRECTEWSCGAPTGSACVGALHLYEDAACTKEFVNTPVGSMSENCGGIIPAGRAIGSKRVSDLAYLSGTCATSGGEPKGSAAVDSARAVTFCCGKPERYEIE